MTALQTKAAEARAYFELKTRDDKSEFWSTKEGRPEWVVDLCHAAHGEMFPDDVRYGFIVDALDALEENEDPDDITLEADIYTHDLTAWLHSRVDRHCYCDDAAEEFGGENTSIIQLIQLGQVREKEEVIASVRSSLESLISEDEETEDEESDDTDAE